MTDVKPYHFCQERIYYQKEDGPEFQNDSPSKNDSERNECKPTQVSYKLHVVLTWRALIQHLFKATVVLKN